MNIEFQEKQSRMVRLSAQKDDQEIGYMSIYFIVNEGHEKPYALFEYLFVSEDYRRQGIGTDLIKNAIEFVKKEGCYKILAQSRHGREGLHEMYKNLGFDDHGKNFRMNLI